MSDELNEPPPSWTWARLEQLAEISAGNPAPQGGQYFENGSHPFVRVQDMGRLSGKKFVDETHDLINDRAIGQCRLRLFPKGTVLFTKSGMSTLLNQRGILRRPAYVVSHIGCAIPSGAVTSEWLYYALRQVDLGVLTQATTLPSLKLSKVAQVEVPLAPLPEQRRVAAKIDALFEQSRTARSALDRIQPLLKKFRQSVLAAAFRGDLTRDWRERRPDIEAAGLVLDSLRRSHTAHASSRRRTNAAPPTEGVHTLEQCDFPDTWVLAELAELCVPTRPITYGILKPGPDRPDGVPYIRVADIRDNKVIVDGIRRTAKSIDEAYIRSRLAAGDLLLSIRGTVGRICRVPPELDAANITQDTARISVDPRVSAEYVAICLRSPAVQKIMSAAIRGVAVRGINIGDVRALQIPLPPVLEQEQIVARVEELLGQADAIEGAVEAARRQADKLDQSILARAFRGELVPQDPNDEPASMLLARIRTERTNITASHGRPIRTCRKKQQSTLKGTQQATPGG